jgi:hypothetical protein
MVGIRVTHHQLVSDIGICQSWHGIDFQARKKTLSGLFGFEDVVVFSDRCIDGKVTVIEALS